MALDLSDTLVVGVTATALFDLAEADSVFRSRYEESPDTAIQEYRDYMLSRENDPLEDGTGMPLIQALLELNKYQPRGEAPLIEVVVMSRNSPETGVRVFNNIRKRDMPISRHAFTGGESVVDYLEAYDVDLFLTTNIGDAQKVIDGKSCAAAIVKNPPSDIEKIPAGKSGSLLMVTPFFSMKVVKLCTRQKELMSFTREKTGSRMCRCRRGRTQRY